MTRFLRAIKRLFKRKPIVVKDGPQVIVNIRIGLPGQERRTRRNLLK